MTTRSVRSWFRASALMAATAANVGCYSYSRLDVGTIAPGDDEMRVQVTDAGGAALAPAVGPYAGALEGRIVEQTDSTIVLSVKQLVRRSGNEETWRGEKVQIPRSGVESIEQRRFARGRSALLVAGLAVLGGIVATTLGGGSAEGGRGPGGGGGTPQ